MVIALNGAALGLLAGESHAAQQTPDVYIAEFNAKLALDDGANSLEGPKLGAKTVDLCALDRKSTRLNSSHT